MLTFTISTALSEAMGLDPPPNPEGINPDLHWWAHCVPVVDQHCVLFMHEPSRYCMIFFDPESIGTAAFLKQFKQRLLREALAVCQPLPKVSERIHLMVNRACLAHQFRVSLDYGASADLFEAARALQTLLEELGGYPVAGMTEFALGIRVNQVLGKQQQNHSHIRLDQFRQYCLDLSAQEHAPQRPSR